MNLSNSPCTGILYKTVDVELPAQFSQVASEKGDCPTVAIILEVQDLKELPVS